VICDETCSAIWLHEKRRDVLICLVFYNKKNSYIIS